MPNMRQVTPRHLLEASWRRTELHASPLFDIADQSPHLPSCYQSSKHSVLLSLPSWRQGNSGNLRDEPSLSHRTDPKLTSCGSISPCSGHNMSKRPGQPTTRHSNRTVNLTAVTLPVSGEARPRLQIEIPGNSAGGEGSSISTINSQIEDPAVWDVGTGSSGPRQESSISEQYETENLQTRRQEPVSEASTASTRAPHTLTASLTSNLQRKTSKLVDDPTPISISQTGKTAARIEIPHKGGPSGQGGHSFSDSPNLGNPFTTKNVSLAGNANQLKGFSDANLPVSADQAPHIGKPIPAKRRAQADALSKADRTLQINTPKPCARRQPFNMYGSRGGPLRRGMQYQPRVTTYTNSRTWVNPRTQFHTRWVHVYKSLKDMSLIKDGPPTKPGHSKSNLGSFCVPKTMSEWSEHLSGFSVDRAKRAKQRLYYMERHRLTPRHPDLPPAGEVALVAVVPFGGRNFNDGRGSVLAWQTTWTPWKPCQKAGLGMTGEDRPEALWPCAEEMKEEGNERNTSQFSRFVPLPRVPGNPTVNWKQKKVLPMLSFDEIWQLPSKETWRDQRTITSPEEMKAMESMIGEDLLKAIDCDLHE